MAKNRGAAAVALLALLLQPQAAAQSCTRTDVVRSAPCGGSILAVQRDLRGKLFGNTVVDATLRDPPLTANDGPALVEVSAVVHRVIELHPEVQTFAVDMTLTHKFEDARFCWNSQDWCNVDSISSPNVRNQDVWLPNTTIDLAVTHHVQGNDPIIKVTSGGRITWSRRYHVRFHCAMNFRYFPFDNQHCKHKLGSTIHSSDLVRYSSPSDGTAIVGDPHHANDVVAQFQVESFDIQLVPLGISTVGNAIQSRNMPIELEFIFRRERGRQFINVFLPIWMVIALSTIGLYIDSRAVPARVTGAVVTVLVLINIQNSLANGLPPLAYISALDVYFLLCLLQTVANAAEYAVTNYLNTEIRTLKEDINVRKDCRKSMTRQLASVQQGDISTVNYAATLSALPKDDKKTLRGDLDSAEVIGVLRQGDSVRVNELIHAPNEPGRVYAIVTVMESADSKLEENQQGTMLVCGGGGDDPILTVDWEKTDAANRSTPYGAEAALARRQHRASSLTGAQKDEIEFQGLVKEKKIAELWEAYHLFLRGKAAKQEDIVAILYHYAGVDPRRAQKWVAKCNTRCDAADQDDLIDFDEFEHEIVPKLCEKTEADKFMRSEPQAITICGTHFTECTVRKLEERFRKGSVVFFLVWNIVWFTLTLVLSETT